MPAMASSRVAARVVESAPDGENLTPGAWQCLEALPDPRSPQRRIYLLTCLIAIAVCAFTGSPRSGSGSKGLPRPTWPRLRAPWDRSRAGPGRRMRKRSGWSGNVRFNEYTTSRTGSRPANLATIRAGIIAAVKDVGYYTSLKADAITPPLPKRSISKARLDRSGTFTELRRSPSSFPSSRPLMAGLSRREMDIPGMSG